jgi:hypothetical protein
MYIDFFSTLLKGYLVLVIIWLVTLIIILVTLFKRTDIGLPVKFFWGIVIFIAPLIGLIFYLIFGLPRRKKVLEKTDSRLSS